jgi:hypothetical protein
MRVEREHACDDYVLRDGTTPSLYAGELLEMVRSIGTPRHDRAAPAFAALAMARRSEFEGRMLAILDPRLDRKSLNRRGTLMTAIIVALLTIPLAALRPFQQPTAEIQAARPDALPESFKVSFGPTGPSGAVTASVTPSSSEANQVLGTKAVTPASKSTGVSRASWTCDTYPGGPHGTSIHINEGTRDGSRVLEYLTSGSDRCTEAAMLGKANFSDDETRIASLSPGGFARFRERTNTFDRAVSVTPVGDGSLAYAATVDGRPAPFDATMQNWLAHLLPEILREAAINVPARVARLRAQGGVPAVLREISQIHSSSAKRAHYEELIKHGPMLSDADADRVVEQMSRDITSSGDLSATLQMLPRSVLQSPTSRKSIAGALSQIKSSGDKATTLAILAPNADPEMLLLLAKAAEDVQSSGDKANFLLTTASEYLSPGSESLRNAYFRAVGTVQSDGDKANVLIAAAPYGHGSPAIVPQIVEGTRSIGSSGDVANVLITLSSQRLIQSGSPQAALAVINRTLTMASSGDRANVLINLAETQALSNSDVKAAFIKAAMALPSEGDRANVLAVAAR